MYSIFTNWIRAVADNRQDSDIQLKDPALITLLRSTSHLRIPRHRLRRAERGPRALGGYSEVWYGDLTAEEAPALNNLQGRHGPVAIKTLRVAGGTGMEHVVKLLVREFLAWHNLHHINIAPFFGYVLTEESASLISPWYNNGNLSNYLAKNPNIDRMPLIIDTVRGVEYLHELDNPIVHGDIKPENVLVDDRGRAKLIDFGLSSVFRGTFPGRTTATELRGTIQWLAVELLDGNPQTDMSDVWSLGLVILEIITGKPPFWESQTVAAICRVIGATHPRDLNYGAFPNDRQWWKILSPCFLHAPTRRPRARVLAQQIVNLDANEHTRSLSLDQAEDSPSTSTGSDRSTESSRLGDPRHFMTSSFELAQLFINDVENLDESASAEELLVLFHMFSGLSLTALTEAQYDLKVKLGKAMTALSRRLKSKARLEECRQLDSEIVTLYKSMWDDSHNEDLALALDHLGRSWHLIRDYIRAKVAAEESVQLWRQLAEENPERYEMDLVTSLRNFGFYSYQLGDLSGAMDAYQEVVNFLRNLAAREPGRYKDDLESTMQTVLQLGYVS